ncbi:MAG TPA: ABC transporter ATP-binding protein [Candidatus Saccharimonadales bacterium]|jgi:putative ABC transport system ATP-binding protein|nr:ABC transporter ATP-binding protein [Candidatus Saccharimonadales bacterium]
MAGRVIIKATNITQQFQIGEEVITPIKDANFELLESSFNIIYGQSGSGKSTLLNILTGLQRPSTGTVLFDEREVYKLSPDELAFFRATRLGIVYQTNYWVQSLNTLENVSLPLYFLGYSRARAAEVAQFALDQVEMSSYAKKYPVLLSGGEQQRIAMARALASSPLFIIADEPTGSLDSTNGDKIMHLLQSAQHDSGRTIILVTHNMEYLPFADHLLHIEDGHIEMLKHDSIKKATDTLFSQMQQRIARLNAIKKVNTK